MIAKFTRDRPVADLPTTMERMSSNFFEKAYTCKNMYLVMNDIVTKYFEVLGRATETECQDLALLGRSTLEMHCDMSDDALRHLRSARRHLRECTATP